ncbi:hypothetical protein pb186bvf_019072 [Paramecium bursaria]
MRFSQLSIRFAQLQWLPYNCNNTWGKQSYIELMSQLNRNLNSFLIIIKKIFFLQGTHQNSQKSLQITPSPNQKDFSMQELSEIIWFGLCFFIRLL